MDTQLGATSTADADDSPSRGPFDPERAMNVTQVSAQNGISSTASSEFGGGWRRGLGARELRLRDRFRE